MNKQSRWRSKVAWTAVLALVFFVLKNYGLLAPIGLTADSFGELTTLTFGVLTAFGIFNDPTSRDSF